MRVSIVRAQRQTNPDVLKLAIIAHKKEWEALIEYLKELDEFDSVIQGFSTLLEEVIINGKRKCFLRTEVETDTDSG